MRRLGTYAAAVAALVVLGLGVHHLTAGAAKPPKPPLAVPVLAATVQARSMPVTVQGLGTVQAYNTVAVKAQVNGQIVKVFFRQGQAVTAGQKLFQIDPRPYKAALDQAVATEAKDRATLIGAQNDLARYAPLVKQNYTSAKVYQDQLATVDELKAAVAVDRAAVEAARVNLDYTLIRSPIDGRTGAILVNLGNVVQTAQGATLVTIAQTRPIYVAFAVPQSNLPAIRHNDPPGGMPVTATGAGGNVLAKGRLSFVNNLVDNTTDTVSLMGSFANENEALWPGEYVTAQLVLSVQPHALTVPDVAVVQGARGYYVYVIGPDDTVRRRAVTVLRRQDGLAVIGKGLSIGERVVEEGQFRLTNGSRVKIDKPVASDRADRRGGAA